MENEQLEEVVDQSGGQELDSMLSEFLPQGSTGEVNQEDQAGTAAEGEEEVQSAQSEEGAETQQQEVQEEVAKTVSTETKDETPSELDLIKHQNELLLKQIEELSGKVVQPAQPVQQEQKDTKDEVADIIGDLDIDDVLSSKELFNAAIGRAMKMAREQAKQEILLSLPQIVISQTQQQMAIKQATDEFYRDNPDLAPMKKTVAAVANELYSTNPQMSISEIFEKSATKTREILGLHKQATQIVENDKTRKPEFVKTGGQSGKQKPPTIDKFQEELDALLNLGG